MGRKQIAALALISLILLGCSALRMLEPAAPALTPEPRGGSDAGPGPEAQPGGGPAQESAATPSAIPTTPPSARDAALGRAVAAVSANGDWLPYYEAINGVPMALVPAGCFTMGSEIGADDEMPPHEVCFERPFWIDLTEVTNQQFEAYGGVAASDASWQDFEQPRDSVDWFEAAAFCALRGARLPSEAEWEYAAAGPDSLIYPWGDNLRLEDVVWDAQGARIAGSEPAGDSWVGASDLAGNLWEWVNDWYGDRSYEGLTQPLINPLGPEVGTHRVRRGGSFRGITASADELRAANRDRDFPGIKGDSVGFRCAADFSE